MKEGAYYFVASSCSPSFAAEWAERMILSDRSVRVERKHTGSWSLFCLGADVEEGLKEWKEVVGCA